MTVASERVPGTLPLRVPWATVSIAAAVAGFLTLKTMSQPEAVDSTLSIRLGQLALAAGAAYLLDDASAALSTTAPRSLWRQRAFPLAIGLGVIATAWTVVLLGLRRIPDAPVRTLTLEVVVLVTLALALSSLLGRRGDPEPGNLVAAVLPLTGFTALLAGGMLDLQLFASSQGPGQGDRVAVWAVLCGIGLVVLARTGRDSPT